MPVDVEFGLLEDDAAEAFDTGLMGDDADADEADFSVDDDVGTAGK